MRGKKWISVILAQGCSITKCTVCVVSKMLWSGCYPLWLPGCWTLGLGPVFVYSAPWRATAGGVVHWKRGRGIIISNHLMRCPWNPLLIVTLFNSLFHMWPWKILKMQNSYIIPKCLTCTQRQFRYVTMYSVIHSYWSWLCETSSAQEKGFSHCLLGMCEPGKSSRVLPFIYTLISFFLSLWPLSFPLFHTYTQTRSLSPFSLLPFPHPCLFSFSQLPLGFSLPSPIPPLPLSISFPALSPFVLFLLLSFVAAFVHVLLHCVL